MSSLRNFYTQHVVLGKLTTPLQSYIGLRTKNNNEQSLEFDISNIQIQELSQIRNKP